MADANGNQTNSLDYAYLNAGPGAVAAGSRAIDSKTESSMDVLNPAYQAPTPQSGQAETAAQEAASGPSDQVNPVVGMNQRDQG